MSFDEFEIFVEINERESSAVENADLLYREMSSHQVNLYLRNVSTLELQHPYSV